MKKWNTERASRLAETERDVDSELLKTAAKQILSCMPIRSMSTTRNKGKGHELVKIEIVLMTGGRITFTRGGK